VNKAPSGKSDLNTSSGEQPLFAFHMEI